MTNYDSFEWFDRNCPSMGILHYRVNFILENNMVNCKKKSVFSCQTKSKKHIYRNTFFFSLIVLQFREEYV